MQLQEMEDEEVFKNSCSLHINIQFLFFQYQQEEKSVLGSFQIKPNLVEYFQIKPNFIKYFQIKPNLVKCFRIKFG